MIVRTYLQHLRNILKNLVRDENGQALLIVLILMLVGGLIIAPLLSYMATGLKAGEVHEQLMQRNYAADAGVWDALWKIMNNQVPASSYNLTVNEKDVVVAIALEEDVEGFLTVLLDPKHKLTVSPSGHGDWAVITHSVETGIYTITVTYTPPPPGHENKQIEGVGAWLLGDYACTDNSPGDDDMTDRYEDYTFEAVENFRAGTAFIWDWTEPGAARPTFQPGDNMTQSFKFTPEQVPSFYFSWVSVQSWDYRMITSGETFGIWKVTSTATDNITEEQTEVASYVLRQGGEVSILTWETSLE